MELYNPEIELLGIEIDFIGAYSELEKYNCMVRCDDTFMNTSKNIQHDPNSSS